MLRHASIVCLLAALACRERASDPPAPKPSIAERPSPTRSSTVHRAPERKATASSAPTAPPTVVLVITDTVRADHTSLCGYSRPTTPYLAKLAQDGASHTCRAFAPGTWTLPSHGSYFTGVSPTQHALLNKGQPLNREFDTLSDIFRAAGYQTAMISANPTLSKASGVWQGFDVVNVPNGTNDRFRGKPYIDQLALTLEGLANDKPLFLVVNLFDAHDPYPAIPDGVAWAPPRKSLFLNPVKVPADHPARRYLDGELSAAEQQQFLEHVTDVYDYGILLADRNLRRTIKLLEDGGWLDEGYRLLVTSDHGENLGDHQQLRHDGPPWASVATVFTVFLDTTLAAQPVLPEPFANQHVFHLARDGRLPDTLERPLSSSIEFHEGGLSHRVDSVALWAEPDHKVLALRDTRTLLRPMTDPRELTSAPVPADDPALPVVQAAFDALMRSKAEALQRGDDPAIMKSLEAIGYLD